MIKWLLGTPPKIGSKWCFCDEYKNPFERDKWTVEIIDVKEGWVKYSYLWYKTSTFYQNTFHTCSIRTLRLICKEIR